MNRKETLVEADKCVNGQREHYYGSPEDNFATIAEMWTTYLRRASSKFNPIVVTAHDVTVMMALLKIARIASGQVKEDNYIDGCGYLACAAEIATNNPKVESFRTLKVDPDLDEKEVEGSDEGKGLKDIFPKAGLRFKEDTFA